MVTCNDCIHQELCDVYSRAGVTDVPADDISICELFKNKADFVEVRCGKWIAKPNPWVKSCYVCSICDTQISFLGSKPKFCPHCGADMRGKSNDNRTEN
jgi:rRNA maturation endonuclease Nob1